MSSLTQAGPDLLSRTGGDPSPRGTESERRLRLAHGEGGPRGCLGWITEEQPEQFVSENNHLPPRARGPAPVLPRPLKSPGVLDLHAGSEAQPQKQEGPCGLDSCGFNGLSASCALSPLGIQRKTLSLP